MIGQFDRESVECAFYNRLSDEKRKGGSEKISAGYTESGD